MARGSNPSRSGESGVALVTVMALLSVLGMLAAAVIASSLYLMRDTRSARSRMLAFYASESALNRALFCLRLDRAAHPERRLGEYDYSRRGAVDRFMADGIRHTIVRGDDVFFVTVTDAVSGIGIAPAATTLPERLAAAWRDRARFRNSDFDTSRLFGRFLDKLTDFLDADNFRQLDGMERDEYRKLNLANLPRNGVPEYADELLMIPGAADFLASGALPPLLPAGWCGVAIPDGRVSLFASQLEEIAVAAELSDRELARLREALEEFRSTGKPLGNFLAQAIADKLEGKVKSDESGFYRIRVEPVDPAAAPVLDAVALPGVGSRFYDFGEWRSE